MVSSRQRHEEIPSGDGARIVILTLQEDVGSGPVERDTVLLEPDTYRVGTRVVLLELRSERNIEDAGDCDGDASWITVLI